MSLVCLAAGDVFVPIKIDENNLYEGIKKLLKALRPTWSLENVKFKVFTDGITNKLVACHPDLESCNSNDVILVRIYGNKTDLIINRHAELRNIKVLNQLGLAPKIYGVFENGLAYQYYPGVTLNVDTVLDDKIWSLIAQQMAKMHKVNLGKEIPKEPMIWEKTEQFLSLLPEPFSTETKQDRFAKNFGSVTRLRIEYERLKSYLSKTESPLVFAHNDLLLGNIIYNKNDGKISFIDYEYAAYNYQAFDIGNHFNEFVGLSIEEIDYNKYPSKDFQLAWITIYLTEYFNECHPSDHDIEKVFTEVQQHALLSNFFWGIWSLVQLELSNIDFDFLRYAEIRLTRYNELKNKVFKELNC